MDWNAFIRNTNRRIDGIVRDKKENREQMRKDAQFAAWQKRDTELFSAKKQREHEMDLAKLQANAGLDKQRLVNTGQADVQGIASAGALYRQRLSDSGAMARQQLITSADVQKNRMNFFSQLSESAYGKGGNNSMDGLGGEGATSGPQRLNQMSSQWTDFNSGEIAKSGFQFDPGQNKPSQQSTPTPLTAPPQINKLPTLSRNFVRNKIDPAIVPKNDWKSRRKGSADFRQIADSLVQDPYQTTRRGR